MMKKMTQKEFFHILGNVRKRGAFEIIDGEIRQKKSGLCPICAVATKLIKNKDLVVDNGDWDIAAQEIHLDNTFAKAVVYAADGNIDTRKEREVRRQLLTTLKLKDIKRD